MAEMPLFSPQPHPTYSTDFVLLKLDTFRGGAQLGGNATLLSSTASYLLNNLFLPKTGHLCQEKNPTNLRHSAKSNNSQRLQKLAAAKPTATLPTLQRSLLSNMGGCLNCLPWRDPSHRPDYAHCESEVKRFRAAFGRIAKNPCGLAFSDANRVTFVFVPGALYFCFGSTNFARSG